MNRKLHAAGYLTLAAGLVVTITVVHKTDPGNQTGTAATPTPAAVPTGTPASESPTSQGPSPVVPTPTPTATPDPHGQHREPSEIPVRAATTAYLRTFFDRKMPTAQWRTQLAAMSTPTHAATLATVPRVAVPNATLTSTKVIRLASGAATVEANCSDKSVLHVGLVLDETGWKVSRVVPYRKVVVQ